MILGGSVEGGTGGAKQKDDCLANLEILKPRSSMKRLPIG